MVAAARETLASTFRALVNVLEQSGGSYLIVGGLAQAVIGEPRMTQDVDCIVAIQPKALPTLVDALERKRFTVDRQAINKQAESVGTFSIGRGRWRIDVILASTDLETSAFQRAQRLRLYETVANFPTPEDLILLKLVPGRDKDLLDITAVMVRHRDRLDRAYLERWAQRLSDEAEDARIWQTLQRLLREADALG